jgi:hypothetical protein
LQFIEHLQLELGAVELQRQVEVFAFAGEVLLELRAGGGERRCVLDPARLRLVAHFALGETDET